MMSLEGRLAALEQQFDTDTAMSAQTQRADALDRIFKALRAALPGDVLQSVPSADGFSRRVVCDSRYRTHPDYLGECHDRIAAGSATDDDRRVLASMPASDLEFIGRTAEDMISIIVKIERAF